MGHLHPWEIASSEPGEATQLLTPEGGGVTFGWGILSSLFMILVDYLWAFFQGRGSFNERVGGVTRVSIGLVCR